MADQPRRAAADATGPMARVAAELGRVRARALALLVIAGVATFIAGGIAVVMALGVLDYLFRTPAWFRMALWLGGAAGGIWAARRWLLPIFQFRPSLTEVALRLERSEQGRAAGLTGKLASSLELSRDPATGDVGRWMAEQVVGEAARRFSAVRASSLLSAGRARDAALTLVVCIAACAALAWLSGPTLFGIGAARVLAPWSGVQWPKRTEIADATAAMVHPLGTALPLRAALVRSDRAAEDTRVAARYRVIAGPDQAGTVHRVLLTPQGRPIAIDDPPRQGELFERLVEPGVLSAQEAELEYWFETDDDQTPPRRIRLVQPPAVVSAKALVTPPSYAASTAGVQQGFVSGSLDLGAGNDQRAVVGPVLGGSRIELTVTLNKPVPGAPENPEERAQWFARAVPGLEPHTLAETRFDGAQWVFAWTAAGTVRLPLSPVDEYGLAPSDEAAFSFDVVEDRPPTATVTEPRADETVLATAVIEAVGEGRDDVGLSDVRLQTQRATPAAGSLGAAPEPVGEPVTVATAESGSGGVRTQALVRTTVDLSSHDLKPGDELWLYAVASDIYAVGGRAHPPVRSAPRRLRIISEEDLVEQVRAELAAVRKIAIRLDEDQAELNRATRSGAISSDDRRRQAGLTQRLQQQHEAVQRLRERVERNRLADEGLKGLLEDVGALLQGAEQDSEQASTRMDAAAQRTPESEPTPLTPEQQEEIARDQDEVRDQLGRLSEMLDRGEDSWLVSRNLQRLAQQQRDLLARTQRAGEQTTGKRAEDLTPRERSELAQIAEQQQRLAEQARQAIDALSERAEQMRQADAAQAEGMQRAAERGRQEQVPEKMDQAAQAAAQNQTSTAEAQQQEALQALEQMLEDMEEAQRNRDAALRRQLASLIESLEKLIQEQDAQVAAIDDAAAREQFAGLDAAMIELNKNTLGVADKARADRAMARIAELVDRAASNQTRAISALRATPVNAETAAQAERESLRLLKLARDEAKRMEEEAAQRDQDRKRRELRRAYREALERQVALKGETDPFVGRTVDRRDRMKVRGLGEKQDAIRASLDEIRKDAEGLTEATVFDYAHQRLDRVTTTAAKKLRAGQADRAVARNQDSAITILKSLIEALDDQARQNDEFQDDSGGGGGGGGGQGEQPLIPPLAELRLLRAMQQEAADLTRAADEAGDEGAAEDINAVGELQRALAERGKELINKLEAPPGPAPEPRE